MAHIETIYLVHHSHTDIGFTHDQPTLWDLERRFIDTALELAAQDRDKDSPHSFKWTVETAAPLLYWLDTASKEQLELFGELEAAGRIEVTGMIANITPLFGPVETIESLRPVQHLRDEYGFDISYAMNSDVNGQNWTLADALLDADIEGFTMSINEHFGGAPLDRPRVFRWEAPSGRELLTYNGYLYGAGIRIGLDDDLEALRETWWPRIRDRLDEIEYELPALMVQSFHPFGDNGPAYEGFSDSIREWNSQDRVESGELPEIAFATPSDWWATVEEHVEDLPVHRGDWTDFWNFGSISAAREQAINRENRRRLITADALEAGLSGMGAGWNDRPPDRHSAPGTRDRAWWGIQLFDEHTRGADTSVRVPQGEDTHSQWTHKAKYAYDGRSLSQQLQRDGIAELARRVARSGGEEM